MPDTIPISVMAGLPDNSPFSRLKVKSGLVTVARRVSILMKYYPRQKLEVQKICLSGNDLGCGSLCNRWGDDNGSDRHCHRLSDAFNAIVNTRHKAIAPTEITFR